VINKAKFVSLYKHHQVILDIIKLPPGTEELTPKIEAFLQYLDDKPGVKDLLTEKVNKLKGLHPAEQLPLLQFYAYSAGLISNLALDEEAVRSFFYESEQGRASSSSNPSSSGQSIYDLIVSCKFAPHRFQLLENVLKMIKNKIPADRITRWESHWTRLSALILFPKIQEDEVNRILDAVNRRADLKDDIYQKILISFMLEMCNIKPAENFRIVHEMILEKLKSRMKTSVLLEQLQAYENIIRLYGTEALINSIQSGGDPTQYFADRFESTFGIQNVENVAGKYSATFANFRDSMALFTYWSGIQRLHSAGADVVKETFKKYLKSVLDGVFREQRYDSSLNQHLKHIFSNADGEHARGVWMANRPQQPLQVQGTLSVIDYRQKIKEKVVTDGHLPLGEYPLLEDYLLNGTKPLPPRASQGESCRFER
jgi:hypothetical protein